MTEELAKVLQISRSVNYTHLASFTVIYFDWLLTFDSEIKLIWNAKGVKMKILYLITRYLPLAYSLPYLYYRFGTIPISECTAVYIVIASMFAVAVICAALVVTLRTCAVWGMEKPTTYALFGTYTVASVLILALYIISLKYTSQKASFNGLYPGCIPKWESPYLPAVFLVDAAYDTVILLLMLIRGASLYRWGLKSRFFRMLYRDGIMFYVYITAISVANVVLLFSHGDYMIFMLPIQGAIRSISACRIILHVRMQYDELEVEVSPMMTSCRTVVQIERDAATECHWDV